MNSIILLSVFVLTACCLLVLRPMAAHVGLVDIPGGRKAHSRPTPMVGGLGIYLGTVCISLLSPIITVDYQVLLGISALVLIIGVLDDIQELRVSIRLFSHAVIAWVMAVVAGNELSSLGDIAFIGPIALGAVAVPFTIFATVGIINAVNMSDGLDGLSGGLVVIALVFLSITALAADQVEMLNFNQILIVALLAFLALNFRLMWKRSAMVYLGDAGSTLLGFILAWLVIAASQGENAFIAPVTALWFLAMPVMDTVSLIVTRSMRGKSPFRPGTDHLHHRLQKAGYSKQETVLGIYAAAFSLGSIGLAGHYLGIREGVMFLLFVTLFFAYMFCIREVQASTSSQDVIDATGNMEEARQ